MARKRTDRSINNISLIDEGEGETSDSTENNPRSWWGGLTRNGRWLIVGVIAFVSIGAFGAGMKYLDDNAKAEKKLAAKDRSIISSINPFVPPDPTPQLSKEYIYAGSRLLAVEDKNASASPPSDLAIWRPSTGIWWVFNPATGGIWSSPYSWGVTDDVAVPGDYDGDGKTDTSVFRPTNSTWYVAYSSSGGYTTFGFGAATDRPAQADYDGDGKTDAAVYRPPSGGQPYGYWYIQGSTSGYYVQGWGEADDIPASADYDGDGKADIAIWRESSRKFYSINSSNGAFQIIDTGISSSSLYNWKTVSSDYDGDGKADYAVYDQSTANWYIRSSASPPSTVPAVQWGAGGDVPVHNDYDGDGKVDLTVWTPTGTNVGRWHIKQSSATPTERNQVWGEVQDIPVPAYYKR